MNFGGKFILKIRDFFRKYGIIITVIIIGILIVFGVNYALKSGEIKSISKRNSVDSFVKPKIDTIQEISDEDKEKIEELIDDYVKSCNDKEYEKAYNMLDDEFKTIYFNDMNKFKSYIDKVFEKEKMYTVENCANINEIYIFNVLISDNNNILATGTTDGYEKKYLEDQYVIKKDNGTFKICLNGFCKQEEINKIVEDDFMKINIVKKIITYENERYIVKITNKTPNYIVLANDDSSGEFVLNISGDMMVSSISDSNIVISPKTTSTKTLIFDKSYTNSKEDTELIFNAIRVLPKYSGNSENLEQEMQNAVKLYSLTIDLKGEE